MLSGNEVRKLKTLRHKLAQLCPETDGLQHRHRIKRKLTGKNRKEQVEQMVAILEKEHRLSQIHVTKLEARLVSLVYEFDGFSSEEVCQILRKEYFKNFR